MIHACRSWCLSSFIYTSNLFLASKTVMPSRIRCVTCFLELCHFSSSVQLSHLIQLPHGFFLLRVGISSEKRPPGIVALRWSCPCTSPNVPFLPLFWCRQTIRLVDHRSPWV